MINATLFSVEGPDGHIQSVSQCLKFQDSKEILPAATNLPLSIHNHTSITGTVPDPSANQDHGAVAAFSTTTCELTRKISHDWEDAAQSNQIMSNLPYDAALFAPRAGETREPGEMVSQYRNQASHVTQESSTRCHADVVDHLFSPEQIWNHAPYIGPPAQLHSQFAFERPYHDQYANESQPDYHMSLGNLPLSSRNDPSHSGTMGESPLTDMNFPSMAVANLPEDDHRFHFSDLTIPSENQGQEPQVPDRSQHDSGKRENFHLLRCSQPHDHYSPHSHNFSIYLEEFPWTNPNLNLISPTSVVHPIHVPPPTLPIHPRLTLPSTIATPTNAKRATATTTAILSRPLPSPPSYPFSSSLSYHPSIPPSPQKQKKQPFYPTRKWGPPRLQALLHKFRPTNLPPRTTWTERTSIADVPLRDLVCEKSTVESVCVLGGVEVGIGSRSRRLNLHSGPDCVDVDMDVDMDADLEDAADLKYVDTRADTETGTENTTHLIDDGSGERRRGRVMTPFTLVVRDESGNVLWDMAWTHTWT